MNTEQLPIAIIGAGPVGLAAAAHLITRGETPVVLEAGPTVGTNILAWGHVRIFSPWRYNIDSAARTLLDAASWQAPNADEIPTGRELVERYLAPLAALPRLASHIRLGHRVLGITRQGIDKMKNAGREQAPFLIQLATPTGDEILLARAVIDASGTYSTPNPLGASGLPAIGERALREHIFYGIPDVLGTERARYTGRRTLVVGSGHSAFNALLDLAELAEQVPGTEIVWAIRRAAPGQMFGGGAADLLPARGNLGARVRSLAEVGILRIEPGFRLAQLVREERGIVASDGQRMLPPVDEIIATTGFRPDLAPLSELRLALDPAVESPVALAPLIDPNLHSCGTVRPHGEAELRQPEPDFYIVGMKSYGRAPTFLMLTGYEQVRSIACALTGDLAGAQKVELELPETGVCLSDTLAEACCGNGGPHQKSSASAEPILALSETSRSCCATPEAAVADRAGGCCGDDCCTTEDTASPISTSAPLPLASATNAHSIARTGSNVAPTGGCCN